MYAFRTLATAMIGVAVSLIALAALIVTFEGVHSALASEASIVAFSFAVLGTLMLFISSLSRVVKPYSSPQLFEDGVEWKNGNLDYTIIIPIFNRPDFLVRLVTRIHELLPDWQQCGSGEIVVINDGSTDQTLAVAMRLAESSQIPMRIVTQPNKGVSGARNRGFWEARGHVGVVIDSDCLPEREWLPQMIAAVNGPTRTLAFATVYSDRRARFPLEASPAGAPFAGASFAARVDDYIGIGGNFEGFSGASRDDGDLYLTSRRLGFRTLTVERARVWHPLRQQTLRGSYRAGLAHRYDNLLLARHGESALHFMGDWILGGSFVGHYPLSLAVYAFLVLCLYNAGAALFFGGSMDAWGLLFILLSMFGLWLSAIATFAKILNVPRTMWNKYATTCFGYSIGCILGRARGAIATGMPLL